MSVKNINKILFLLFIFCCIIILNCINKNSIEGYTGFSWNDFENNTQDNIKNLQSVDNPPGYFPNSNTLCNLPECNTFSGVENTWNISRNANNNVTGYKDGENDVDYSNYRVVVQPFDFLRFNKILPICCNYNKDYSSGGGCLCLTPQQNQLLKFRYGNRS